MNKRFLKLLLLVSALGVVLLLGRTWYTGTLRFGYLIWNSILAWVPFLISLLLAARWKRMMPSLRYATVFIWLIFFPNAPYLVTDLIHLGEFPEAPLWYDAVILTVFSWLGLMLGFASLSILEKILHKRFGASRAHIFVYVSLLLSSFGIYIGRFLRWNSWDIISHPIAVLWESAIRLTEPRTLVVTIVFTAFLTVAYWTVVEFPTDSSWR